jgi:hypothetical protein
MALKYGFLLSTFALSNFVASMPLDLLATEHMLPEQVANLTQTIDRQMLAAYQCEGENCSIADLSGSTGRELKIDRHILAALGALECRGQSCLIADTAGSTGRVPTMKAEGASDADLACIVSHNPPLGEFLKKYSGKPPDVPRQDTTFFTTLMKGLNSMLRPQVAASGSTVTGKFNGTCAPNILIFAKGTYEPGAYGVFIGPYFTAGLPSGWSTAGIEYDVDIPGNFCLGLPGGMVAKDVINQAAQQCPQSNLFVSGYSQGAMAIRNGLARADDSAKAKVKVKLALHIFSS